MLFNSYSFLFGFLPIVLAGFFFLGQRRPLPAAAWLTVASLVFYAWWDPRYVPLLLGSILFNFYVGQKLADPSTAASLRKPLLTLGVTGDLALLGYFKYANFFVESLNAVAGGHLSLGEIVLPLGISFFTFTQIAFLVDAYRREAKEYSLVHYALFVTYFPHLIAGPVLHHKEMMPQFAERKTYTPRADNFAIGISIFFIGLFKKTVLADGIAPYVSPIFASAARGEQIGFFDAWGAALAYSVQLYFDFSAYSDMAIGLSRMFGVRLPLNFFSPYQAENIIEFWRRWHITLSRFLRDYLYIALGGNRKGPARRYVHLAVTMVLGGLWHGAGWTFVVWGALHGVFLVINHGWRALRVALGQDLSRSSRGGRMLAQLVTLLVVVVAWVFFRAADMGSAVALLRSMCGLHGIALPGAIMQGLGPLEPLLRAIGITAAPGGGSAFVNMYAWIIGLWAVALFAPNTAQFMGRANPALDYVRFKCGKEFWRPTPQWSAAIAVLGACGVLSLTRVSEFLYFQF